MEEETEKDFILRSFFSIIFIESFGDMDEKNCSSRW